MATKDANVSSQQHSVPRRVGSTLTLCSSRPSYPAGPDCAGNLAGHPICAGGLSHGLSGRQQTTVYVGGFSPDTTATLLHSAFIPFGDILDISLPSDPARKGAHKGFAFITFATPEAALDACDNMHRNCLPTVTNRGGSSRSTRQSRQREPASMAAISRVSSLCTGHFARSLQDVFLLTFRYSLCPAAPTCPNLCSRTASLGLGGVDRSTRHSWSRRTRRWSAGRGRRRVLTRRGVNPPHESRAAVPTTLL